MIHPLRSSPFAVVFVALVFALVGCGGSEQGAAEQGASPGEYTDPENAPSAPEPADAPPIEEQPTGEVVKISNEPEGVVADPKTGLVAVGLRDPNQLALVDGSNGEVAKKVDLPGNPRHLAIAGPGGPVLVTAESADTFLQVGLPDGEIESQTQVGSGPHNTAVAPDGRIFVVNESGSTASVIEGDRVVDTIDTPLQPGGVAVTDSGVVGIVGVRGLALEAYDASSLKPRGHVDAGRGPTHVRAGPGDRFYVADTRGDAILVYETSPELKQVGRVSLPGTPYGMDIDPGRNQLWVTLTAKNQVVQLALEGDTLRELHRYPTVRQPNTVAMNTDNGRVYVAGRVNGELQILEPQES